MESPLEVTGEIDAEVAMVREGAIARGGMADCNQRRRVGRDIERLVRRFVDAGVLIGRNLIVW